MTATLTDLALSDDPTPRHRRSPMEHERDDAADWTGWRPSYDGEDVDPGEPYQRGETR